MNLNRENANAAQAEISRKDFEGSIERKIDVAVPYDQKLASQAAKLGKPFAEAGKNSKTVAPLTDLLARVAGAAEELAEDTKSGAGKGGGKGKTAGKSGGGSLLGNIKNMMSKSNKK